MHRTQVLLEKAQYQALREEARRAGKSLGQLVRDYVALGLESGGKTTRSRRVALRRLRGMFRKRGLRGRDHDRHLYGEPE